MVSTGHLLAFAAAAFVLIVIPGPSVLFAVGRALALGRRPALLTVLGNAIGTMVPLLAVTVGLGAVVAASAVALMVIKFVGALYLVYLGVQAIRHRTSLAAALNATVDPVSDRRALRQGFVVGMTNPKAIVFFAAVLPQFAEPAAGSVALQFLILGLVFLVIAVLSDSSWALLAGTARAWFARSPRRLEAVGGVGGLMIIGVGATVAVSGSAN
ncbi:LysE family translocator [Antrihabitans cavernicola]|uniref:LysE family translocator n=1 Tax=Antrihabitans cavernicola TaxID=2495913 RepID=A0A5A7S4X6_9NOCA|nr:LysE family translocator [Spelaeibacter cavernicola]KAA0021230.1 LysE family translocator [Spelaeibacter cavernicola]